MISNITYIINVKMPNNKFSLTYGLKEFNSNFHSKISGLSPNEINYCEASKHG